MAFGFDLFSSPNTGSWVNPDTGQTVPISSGANFGGVGNISNLLNLIGSGIEVGNTFKGYKPTSAEEGQKLSMANQSALLQAMLDPNSTIYKNMFAANQKESNDQTQRDLNSLMQMQRKAQLMGRGSFFNPERQDETISTYLSNRADTNANVARSNALNDMLKVANSYGSQAFGYGNMIPQQQQAQTRNRESTSNGLSGIAQLLPMIAKVAPMFL